MTTTTTSPTYSKTKAWRKWTPQEDEMVRTHYPDVFLDGRSWDDIKRRASRLGVSNPPNDHGAAPFVHRWVKTWPHQPITAPRSVFELAP